MLLFDLGVFMVVVGATVLMLVAIAHQSLRRPRRRTRADRGVAAADRGGARLMEVVLALAIGVLGGSGVWLLLRPRTFQVVLGLALLSYAVNLFIFGMGRLASDQPPIIRADGAVDSALYADPVPQALVLTAIVIGFATTALFLVVLLALRGLTGTDHVDGREPRRCERLLHHLPVVPIVVPLLAGAVAAAAGATRGAAARSRSRWPRCSCRLVDAAVAAAT